MELTAEMVVKFRAIHQVVRKIPRGRVVTYGQLAELAGFPGASRMAGAAMKRSEGLPWQRVVGKAGPRRGRIAIHDPVGAAVQRHKLAEEGVPVSEAGLINLSEFGWIDAEPLRRAGQRAARLPAARPPTARLPAARPPTARLPAARLPAARPPAARPPAARPPAAGPPAAAKTKRRRR